MSSRFHLVRPHVGLALLVLSAAVGSFSCGGSGSSDESDSSGVTTVDTSSSSEASSSTEGSSSSESSGTSDTSSSTSGDGDGDGDTDGGPNLGVCADLLECSQAVGFAGNSTLVGTYGEQGTCWSTSGVSEQDCWIDCVAQIEMFSDLYPEVLECRPCDDDSDCAVPSRPYCDPAMKNCFAEAGCDPINGACPSGDACGINPNGSEPFLSCGPTNGAPLYSACTEIGNRAECGEGLFCSQGDIVDDCTSAFCCLPYCDFGDDAACQAIGAGSCVGLGFLGAPQPSPMETYPWGVCF